jgi:hypothetical protein
MLKAPTDVLGCACCSRRRFLAGCGGLALAPLVGRGAAAAPRDERTRIRVIYSLHAPVQPGPDWPNKGFDFRPVMERFNAELPKRCPDFEFLPATATGPEEAAKILAQDVSSPADGYLVFQMNCWNRVVQTIVPTGKPVLYADYQYAGSGGFLVYTAGFLRKPTPNLGFVASSRSEDLAAAVRCFAAAKKEGPGFDFAAATAKVRIASTPRPGDLSFRPDPLKPVPTEEVLRLLGQSRILAVRDDKTSGHAQPILGIAVENVTFAEVNEAWKNADREAAQAVADRWQKNARVVEGVSRETLETSAAMYLGMKDVLRKHEANAITINCLGGFYGGHIHAYPCLGFHELCNEGLVGACEADVNSTVTQLVMAAMTRGRTGFISDPVIDTGRRRIVYAHCVAPNRAFGPEGEGNPYEILTHSEDRQGASLRSILPEGYLTTTLEVRENEILFHQAKAVGNDPDDRACRTKLCAEPVGDIEKLFTMWDTWGWHRVTCYGDLKAPVEDLAKARKMTVVAEA